MRVPTRHSFLIVGAMVGLAIILSLVILSPFGLAELARYGNEWSKLSNIGQTYGAVSALLSSLALGGVAISLLYQARDSRTAREQTTRTFHNELIKMELDDPGLMSAMGAPWGLEIPADSTTIREYLYVQMWVSFWAGNYVIGELPDMMIRHLAANELFRSSMGRIYWEAVGRLQLSHSGGRRHRYFRILDEEYRRVKSENIPVVERVMSGGSEAVNHVVPRIKNYSSSRYLLLVGATATGIMIGWACGRRK